MVKTNPANCSGRFLPVRSADTPVLSYNTAKIPDIYLSCAEDDVNLINPTRKFKEFLEQNKNFVNYYYREGQGGHCWKYWDMQLEEVINWLLD